MTAAPADETVFAGDHLRATLLAGQRDRLIVTFDYRQTGRSGFNAARHSSTFARGGFWQLNIQSRANDWFINPETQALEAALAGLRGRFKRVNLFGFSMGGYGAMRFARALAADQAVLVSPQFSIAPSVVPWETRYAAEAAGFDAVAGDLAAVAVTGLAGLVLLDPFVAADLRHARLIAGVFPGLALARLAFAGHPATRVMRSAGRLWAVHREVTAAAGPERRLVCDAHRAGRRGSAGYWTRLADHAEARRPGLAARARDAAARLGDIPDAP